MKRTLLLFICFVWVVSAVDSMGQTTKEPEIVVRTDQRSIASGKEMFKAKCADCHRPDTEYTVVGPGLKGILKNPTLPVSKKPATPENVAAQIRHPYGEMPLFRFSREEILDLIAYLNTL